MAYDIFGVNGGATTAPPTYKTNTATKNAGSNYDIFNIGSVTPVANPNGSKAKTSPQKPTRAPAPKQSFLQKVGGVAKNLASGATQGEQKFSQGIARDLPGGSNDLKAENQSAQVDTHNQQTYANLLKTGKINKAQYQKLTGTVAKQSGANQTAVTATEKSMPTKAQIALGAASTAADIATAGAFSKGKAGLTSSKALIPLFEGTGKKVAAKEITTKLASNATAGGLNAAAAGGTKKQIIENAAAGALLPEVLHQGADLVHVGASKVADKLNIGNGDDAKALLKNQQVHTLLQAGQSSDTTPEYTPSNAKVKTLMEAKRKQQDAIEAPGKQAVNDQAVATKAAADTQAKSDKIDNQVELINAKKADGKFTNVDKVKVKQLTDEKQQLQPTGETTKVEAADSTKNPAQFAKEYLKNNPEKAQADYNARTKVEFGNTKNNIVSGDEAKFIIPDFGPNKSVPYHEAASAFAKEHYAKLLKDPATKDQPVMIMAGGAGAGKTASLREVSGQDNHLDNYAAVVDTNLTDMAGADSRINAARESGRDVVINYVYRHPEEAYRNGVIPRAARTGRVVTPSIHADTHAGSHQTIFELADKYKNDPHVEIRAIDNSRGAGSHAVVPLDFLKNKGYTKEQVELKIHQLLDEHLSSGKITKEQYHELKGTNPGTKENPRPNSGRVGSDAVQKPEAERTKREVTSAKVSSRKPTEYKPDGPEPRVVPIEQPKVKSPDIGTSKLASSTEQKAIDKKLTTGFADKPEYAKVNVKEQSKAAIELLKSDPDKAIRVALGQDTPPGHLLPESLYVAVENHALKTGNVDLLRQLATEGSLSSEATGMGQRLRLLGERDPDSAVTAMRKVADARKAGLERKMKTTVAKATSKEIQQIRAAKATIPKPTKETFASFVDSLKC